MCDAIYIHVPFCVNKCEYCDFLSFKSSGSERDKYVEYLKREIELYPDYTYDTVYFGGGTPSLLKPEDVEGVLKKLHIAVGAEVTLEVNPKTVDYDKLKAFREAGINRVSIGVQSFNEKHLKTLGRLHDKERAIATYEAARRAGFDNISIDLMFSLPEQTMGELNEDLDQIIEMKPEHISIYSLIWEEGTPFFEKLSAGVYQETDNDLEANMYEGIIERLRGAGYVHYEISNFALPGMAARHNSKYWENREYVGAGLGASGYVDGIRYKNLVEFIPYYDKIDEKIKPVESEERVDSEAEEEYRFILGLRLLEEGVEASGRYLKRCEELERKGLLERRGKRFVLSQKGVFLANDVFEEFLD